MVPALQLQKAGLGSLSKKKIELHSVCGWEWGVRIDTIMPLLDLVHRERVLCIGESLLRSALRCGDLKRSVYRTRS